MRSLIVNADDFGLTPGVTAGILAACRRGIVTSTSVLVTTDVSREQVAEAFEAGLGLGLHVNFTLGRPMTRGASLVDGDGRFVRDARRAAAGAEVKDVERELEAQIDRFLTLARRAPTHFDSHHHVGVYAPIAGVVLAAAQRLGLSVRSQDAATRHRARSAGLRTPDHFFGESGPDAYWTPARTLQRLRTLPDGVSEFMTHPGWFDDALSYSRYGRQREFELVGVGAPAARAAATALGIRLCTFADLAP
jgi:predicted glycoside hydrolase/deacetylase ChbG (UPF0249 family)